MKYILDPIERARFQALFKTCQDLVKGSKDELAKFEDVVSAKKKSKGIWAKLQRFMYVQLISHANFANSRHRLSVCRCFPMLTDGKRNRFKFDEKDFTRARIRIHQALSRLTTALQVLKFELLQHINLVVERTAIDVADTRAGVEQTGKGVERTEKGVERTEKGVERTERSVEDTKAGVERTEKRVERTEQGVEFTKAGVIQLQEHENVKHSTTKRQKIIDWVCPSEIDYTDQQNALLNRRQQGIGEWFLEKEEYKSWLRGDHTALLCSGMPGVGKTMITSFVVSNVLKIYENDNQTGIVYIYCQYP
jgi:hypothetical protein